MIEEKEALETIISTTPVPVSCKIPTEKAYNLHLLNTVKASHSSPKRDQSSMDGFGINVCSKKLLKFEIIGQIFAGEPFSRKVEEGEAVRVFTGSNIPIGVNAVIMQEDCKVSEGKLVLREVPNEGQFIRKRGEIFCEGQTISKKGKKIGSSTMAALISAGILNVRVPKQLRVRVISTGDEVIPIDNGSLEDFQIYNSNAYMIKSALNGLGIDEVSISHVADKEELIIANLKKLLECNDILISSGGISVGKKDLIRRCLLECGVKEKFWRVRIKPSKPIFYGTYDDHCQVYGLPGNPVSSYVGFLLFVLPAINLRNGVPKDKSGLPTVKIELSADLVNNENRVNYMMGEVNGRQELQIHGKQTSNNILGLSNSNVLVRVEPLTKLESGETIDALIMP